MASWKSTGTYVLQRFGFRYSSPQSTPLATGHSLSAPPSDVSVEPSCLYPELVSCLMYLMNCTRPDLAYPRSILARYVAHRRHRPEHWEAAKRVLCYLCSTSGMGLVLGGRGPVVLTGHADASWVDDLATQRCEAEIYVGAMAAQELRWLTYMLNDLVEQPRSSPVLHGEEREQGGKSYRAASGASCDGDDGEEANGDDAEEDWPENGHDDSASGDELGPADIEEDEWWNRPVGSDDEVEEWRAGDSDNDGGENANGDNAEATADAQEAAMDANEEAEAAAVGIVVQAQDNGWMDESAVQTWLSKEVLPHLNPQRGQNARRAMLVLDSYRGHITQTMLQSYRTHSITPAVIPAGCTS
ncbi:unnamed protein product [Closterium sp. NIES-53]